MASICPPENGGSTACGGARRRAGSTRRGARHGPSISGIWWRPLLASSFCRRRLTCWSGKRRGDRAASIDLMRSRRREHNSGRAWAAHIVRFAVFPVHVPQDVLEVDGEEEGKHEQVGRG